MPIITVTKKEGLSMSQKGRIIKVIKKDKWTRSPERNNYRGHPKGRIIEVIRRYMPYITVTKKDILLGSQRDWGHENERGRIIEVEKGKKGTILEVKKGRTLVRTSQPVKILPVCSNGTETVVGISNRHLIMEVLEIVYLRSWRFCINAHAFILLRSLIFF